MNKVFLALGSNMGDSRAQLKEAIEQIGLHIGKVKNCSSIYQTAAWGNTDQPDFLNQVIEVQSGLSPQQTIKAILEIEKKMGRVRSFRNAPRVIDIDVLFYNAEQIHENNLQVPHPELPNRRFVLEPLNEVAPDLIHPKYKISVGEMLARCTDQLDVKKF